MDVLLLGLIDYPRLVEAVGLYGHQSRGRSVFNRKNQFEVPLHGRITASFTPSSLRSEASRGRLRRDGLFLRTKRSRGSGDGVDRLADSTVRLHSTGSIGAWYISTIH
jgi:hypothetical protein